MCSSDLMTMIDSFTASTELVFINFYADWCRFSNMLAPIFNEAADKVNSEFPDRTKVSEVSTSKAYR